MNFLPPTKNVFFIITSVINRFIWKEQRIDIHSSNRRALILLTGNGMSTDFDTHTSSSQVFVFRAGMQVFGDVSKLQFPYQYGFLFHRYDFFLQYNVLYLSLHLFCFWQQPKTVGHCDRMHGTREDFKLNNMTHRDSYLIDLFEYFLLRIIS